MKQRLRVGFAALVALAGMSATGQERLTNEHALRQFAGVWELTGWEETLADGTKREHPVTEGRIIFADIGEFCAVVMDPNRAKWRSANPTPDEALAGMNSRAFYAYCAKAEMHAPEGYYQYRTIVDKTPNTVGTLRKRWFEFLTPDRVRLRIDRAELQEPIVESALIWERVTE